MYDKKAIFSRPFLFAVCAVGPAYLLAWIVSRIRRREKTRKIALWLKSPRSSLSPAAPFLYLRSFADDQFIGHDVWRRYKKGPFDVCDVFEDEDGHVHPLNPEYVPQEAVHEYDKIVGRRKTFRVLPRKDWELERELDARFFSYGVFVAIGSDSYSDGAARIKSSDEGWREDVEHIAAQAKLIICVPGGRKA
jgi:hypothetical protein